MTDVSVLLIGEDRARILAAADEIRSARISVVLGGEVPTTLKNAQVDVVAALFDEPDERRPSEGLVVGQDAGLALCAWGATEAALSPATRAVVHAASTDARTSRTLAELVIAALHRKRSGWGRFATEAPEALAASGKAAPHADFSDESAFQRRIRFDPKLQRPDLTLERTFAQRVQQAWLAAETYDDYHLIGVDPAASPSELRHHVERFCSEFGPAATQDADLGELMPLASALAGICAEVQFVFGDPSRRRAYDEEIGVKTARNQVEGAAENEAP